MRNRYPGTCCRCSGRVGRYQGECFKPAGERRYRVVCSDCAAAASDGDEELEVLLRQDRRDYRNGISVIRTSGGTFYRNAAGRCEDAPCCGCCTI